MPLRRGYASASDRPASFRRAGGPPKGATSARGRACGPGRRAGRRPTGADLHDFRLRDARRMWAARCRSWKDAWRGGENRTFRPRKRPTSPMPEALRCRGTALSRPFATGGGAWFRSGLGGPAGPACLRTSCLVFNGEERFVVLSGGLDPETRIPRSRTERRQPAVVTMTSLPEEKAGRPRRILRRAALDEGYENSNRRPARPGRRGRGGWARSVGAFRPNPDISVRQALSSGGPTQQLSSARAVYGGNSTQGGEGRSANAWTRSEHRAGHGQCGS